MGISRMVDITPNPYMTRKTFVSAIVRTLLLEGDGNSVVIPKTKNGYLYSLKIRFRLDMCRLYRMQQDTDITF